GITELKAKGAYTGEDKTVLMVAIPHTETSKIKKLAVEIDPESFIIIGDASEIIGQGFKSPKERI
ncbi:MAG: YitT family protein, partial [Caldiserica bacterium]|nr:YitT family protein [Caldisericota bacterium]